ncbi:MAG TPA: dTMP kinase [Gaiellaceae bacterium]|nr:dTMP kinase [Gaiellaceae bacterium]
MFVTFEGVDGSGKTTQAELLAGWLREQGRNVLLTREPGGTPLGERVRGLLLEGEEMGAWAEAALFAAARAEHVERAIAPALADGADVVSDRYLDSSVAYQGIARGLGEARVRDLSLIVTGGLLPQRTFLLLVAPTVARGRAPDEPDRIEREEDAFMERVDAAYRELASHDPERIVALDAAREPETVAEEVREHVRALL